MFRLFNLSIIDDLEMALECSLNMEHLAENVNFMHIQRELLKIFMI